MQVSSAPTPFSTENIINLGNLLCKDLPQITTTNGIEHHVEIFGFFVNELSTLKESVVKGTATISKEHFDQLQESTQSVKSALAELKGKFVNKYTSAALFNGYDLLEPFIDKRISDIATKLGFTVPTQQAASPSAALPNLSIEGINTKRVEICTNLPKFETSYQIASYYKDFRWFLAPLSRIRESILTNTGAITKDQFDVLQQDIQAIKAAVAGLKEKFKNDLTEIFYLKDYDSVVGQIDAHNEAIATKLGYSLLPQSDL